MRESVPAAASLFASLLSPSYFSANDTLLPVELVQRGVELAGDDARLRCVRAALTAGNPVAVNAIGGSISAGSSYSVRFGGSGAWLYHSKVVSALRSALPVEMPSADRDAAVFHHNGALPATGPAFFEHCVGGQLRAHPVTPSAPRLVLVEFSVNTDGQPEAFERLLRKLLELQPPVAVIVVSMHVWTLANRKRTCWKGPKRGLPVTMLEAEQRDEQTWEDRFNFGDEDAIAALCKHYNVPLVSMRSALLKAVKANTDPSSIIGLHHFMNDCKHPTGQGHTYMAQLVLNRLLTHYGSTGPESPLTCGSSGATRPQARLPQPVYETGLPRGVSRCVNGAQMQRLPSVATRGFTFTGEGRGKFGWVGRSPGDEISFCLFGSDLRRGSAGAVDDATPAGRRLRGRANEFGGGAASSPRCIDSLPAPQCQVQRAFCGDHKYSKLLTQCPASCGLCVPDSASIESDRPTSGGRKATKGGGKASGTRGTSGRMQKVSPSPVGLWVGYLQSYEHMGRATLHCSGACKCAPTEIDAHSTALPRVSITAVQRVSLVLTNGNGSMADGETGECCKLRLTIDQGTSSGEHKFKLLALLLAEARKQDNWQPPGIHVGAAPLLELMTPGVEAKGNGRAPKGRSSTKHTGGGSGRSGLGHRFGVAKKQAKSDGNARLALRSLASGRRSSST